MAFNRSAVKELSSLHREPDWLRARRLTSFAIYEGMAAPDTKRQEDWRQVDLKGLDPAMRERDAALLAHQLEFILNRQGIPAVDMMLAR